MANRLAAWLALKQNGVRLWGHFTFRIYILEQSGLNGCNYYIMTDLRGHLKYE